MDVSEAVDGAPVVGEVEVTQQPSKKRALADTEQGESEPNGLQPRQASSAGPEAKRAKTGQRDENRAEGEGNVEDKLGQVGEALQGTGPEPEEMGRRESDGGRRVTRLMASTSGGEADADSKRTTRSAAKAPTQAGWNQGITSQIRTSLGGPAATAAPAPAPAPAPTPPKSEEATPAPAPASAPEPVSAPETAPAPEPAPAPGNPSKFAKSAEGAQRPAKKTRQERRKQKEAQDAADRQQAQQELKKPFVYGTGLVFLQPSKRTLLQPKGNNLGTDVWKPKFKSWCQSFTSRNIEQKHLINADIVHAALHDYIDNRAKWSKKKQQGVAAAEARKPYVKNDIASSLAAIFKSDSYLLGTEQAPLVIDDNDDNDAQEVPSPSGKTAPADTTVQQGAEQTPAEDVEQLDEDALMDRMEVENHRPGPPIMSEEEDAAQQRKYFPGLSASEQICVYCASIGHTSSSCPKTACRFCDFPSHFSWNCPTRERCTKCRQLGHGKAQCTEKLVHLDEEGMQCAVCGSTKHLEDDCEALWRSYKPRKDILKKVRQLPAFCGFCGAEGHYSSDCGLRNGRPISQTWSLKNRDLYVDKNSPDMPISDFASVPQQPLLNLQIKGSAAKRDHVFYADSDGSEDGEFIGQKVQPRAPARNIQVSSNIQFSNFGPPPPQQPQQNGRGQHRGEWSAQPPLPPGPPPPGPPPGSYSRMSKSYNNAPPPGDGIGRSGLPPKPPAPQSQSQSQQSQLGRFGFHSTGPPPPSGPAPKPPPKKQRTRNAHPTNAPTGPAQQQKGGGTPVRRRGKNKRGGRQG